MGRKYTCDYGYAVYGALLKPKELHHETKGL
jgi:hypothetical protein